MNTTEIVNDDRKDEEKDSKTQSHRFLRACFKRLRQKELIAATCILVFQMCERVVYYSVVANMVLFCTSNLDFDTVNGSAITLVFAGFVYLMPVLGGYVSDAHLGRFITILLSSIILTAGLVLLVVSADDDNCCLNTDISLTGKRSSFLAGLILIAVGTGGIKANISPFGAEQVEVLGKRALNSFFNWFYWITSVGSVTAFTGVAYIQQNISFFWGFVTPLAVMVAAILIYVVAKPLYKTSKPEGSALKTAVMVIWQGCCRRSSLPDPEAERVSENPDLDLPEKVKHKAVLDKARQKNGGGFDDVTVSGVHSVLKVLPFCALVIMFWIIFSQTQTSYFVQALRMDVRVGHALIPAAMLSSFTNLSIVIAIPLLDRVVYPCLSRMAFSFTLLRKIGVGLTLSTLSVVIAGVVEIQRKEVMEEPGGFHIQNLAQENFTASSLSVFVQTPQFALIGLGEIFTAATTLEMGYTQAPPSLQGLLTGLFYAASGVGNFLSMGLMFLIKDVTSADPWWGNEINEVKMENFMFLLAVLMAINFIVFCVVAHRCKLSTVISEDVVGAVNSDERDIVKNVKPVYTLQPSVDILSQSADKGSDSGNEQITKL